MKYTSNFNLSEFVYLPPYKTPRGRVHEISILPIYVRKFVATRPRDVSLPCWGLERQLRKCTYFLMDYVLYVSVNLTPTPSTRCLAVSLQVTNKYSFCRILDDAVNSNPHPLNATFRGLVVPYPKNT